MREIADQAACHVGCADDHSNVLPPSRRGIGLSCCLCTGFLLHWQAKETTRLDSMRAAGSLEARTRAFRQRPCPLREPQPPAHQH
eukprot:2387859-Pleurochrysis_carterae.AAC.4